jgi:flagellar biosynthesis chaperone FliJ
MSSYALYTLRDLRLTEERQAEQALGEALAGVRRAEAETERLTARTVEARAAEVAARAVEPASGSVSAAAAQTARRFSERLRLVTRAAVEALDRHRVEVVTPAVRAEATARAAHLRARQRREVVEKAIARREALRRQGQERREEAVADELAQRRKS